MKTSHRVLLALTGIALTYAALIGAWYGVENYRGARVWDKARHELEARGESLDAAHFIPPPIPDDQNLAMAPVFTRLYQYKLDPATGLLTFSHDGNTHAAQVVDPFPYGAKANPASERPPMLNWTSGHRVDLARYQRYFRSQKDFPLPDTPRSAAEDVLTALTRHDALVNEFTQAASARPLARFPVNWTQRSPWAISLPHENFLQKFNQYFWLHACANLALGRTDICYVDLRLSFRLSRILRDEPTLISHVIDIECLKLLLQPIWDGLTERRWSAAQLVGLQGELRQIDLLLGYQTAQRVERAVFVVPTREELRGPDGFKSMLWNDPSYPGGEVAHQLDSSLAKHYPAGWADESVAITCLLEQTGTIDAIDSVAHRIFPNRIIAGARTVASLPSRPTYALPKMILGGQDSIVSRTAWTQSAVDEAFTACALERYFLDHQAYPASLDALVPTYLPRVPTDVIDGAPMRYQLIPNGRYQLWEVGWNGRDEGGTVAWTNYKDKLDDKQGDWVWQYEPINPPGSVAP